MRDRVKELQICAQDIAANADKLLAEPEEIELWPIADDNSRDAIEEMAEKLGKSPEQVKEYISKIAPKDIDRVFQYFRDTMVATRGE